MNDPLVDPAEQSVSAGLIHIDLGQILDSLSNAATAGAQDRYLVACASVQFWADLLVVGKLNGVFGDTTIAQLEEQLRGAECAADYAAQAMLGRTVDAPEEIDHLRFVTIGLNVVTSSDLLSKVLHLPMPECCGYDLAELTLIASDVDRLVAQVRLDRAFLIVGVRTGGAYLAPLWKAALNALGVADVHWCTVRSQEECAGFDGFEIARAWLKCRFAPVIVVVDDQPDTGHTMERVAALLRAPDVDLWLSSVGKLWHGTAPQSASALPSVYVRRDALARRLWECLLPDDHPEFIARLRCTAGIPPLPAHTKLRLRCTHGEARYGDGRAWLPWNDSRVLNRPRSLVNPRKTPIEVLGQDGEALLHLRFIGEGVFGRAEFERSRKMSATDPAWLVDGYAISIDIGAARSFQSQFHTASQCRRDELLLQAASWLIVPALRGTARSCHSPVLKPLGHRWSAMADAMRERCGCDALHEIGGPLSAFLMAPAPWPGRAGRTFRSSLRYGSGSWHWQVDQNGRLHRFQLEANWGDVSFLELEAAAFILENRLAIEAAGQLASLCGLSWSSVRQSFSLAALMIGESRLRSVRLPSERGRITLYEDFRQLISTTSELAEIKTSSGT